VWTEVIVHHSAGPDTPGVEAQGYRKYHVRARGWRDIGYNYVVERLGEGYEVICGRPLNWEGSHCPGHNQTAIGVCLAGDFTHAAPPAAQLAVAAKLIAGLLDTLDLPSEAVSAHRDHRATACPGEAFDLAVLLGMVEAARRR